MNLFLVFLFAFNLFLAPPHQREEKDLKVCRIENRFMAFSINPSGYLNIDNKLSGQSFNLNSEIFSMIVEREAKNVHLESRKFKCESIQKPSSDRVVILF